MLTRYFQIKNTKNSNLMDALIELTSKVFEVPISDARSKVIRALAESSDPLDCLNKLRRTNH